MTLTSQVRAAINRRAHAIGHSSYEQARAHLLSQLEDAADVLTPDEQLQLVDRIASTFEGKTHGSHAD